MKWGIIGCGEAGRLHLATHAQLEGIDTIACCDINDEKLFAFSQSYRISNTYTNYLDMIETNQLDAVDICTLSPSHCEITVNIAKQRIVKAIICEKPMAYTLQEADEMIEACTQYGVKLFVMLQRRFALHHTKIKTQIDQYAIGELRQLYVSMYEDFFDYGPHFIDLMLMYCGEVDSVLGQIGSIPKEKTKGYYSAWPVIGAIKFKNGCTGFIENIDKHIGTFRFVGTDGEIITNLDEYNVFPAPFITAFKQILKDIKGEGNALSTAINGRKCLEIILAIYESSRLGKEIKLPLNIGYNPLEIMRGKKITTSAKKQARILIGFDAASYISKDMPVHSRAGYALRMADALNDANHIVHFYNNRQHFNYLTYDTVPVDFNIYDRIISFADPDFCDYHSEMGELLKTMPAEKLYLITHKENIFKPILEINWSHIISFDYMSAELLKHQYNDKKIKTWYPGIRVLTNDAERRYVIANVRHSEDAEITYNILTALYQKFGFRCYALCGEFLMNTVEGVTSYMKLQDSGFVDVLSKMPYPSFLKMLNRSILFLEPTTNYPIWNAAEALVQGAMVIRPEGIDEFLIQKNPLAIHDLNNIDIESLISNVDKVLTNGGEKPLIAEMRRIFDFQQQQKLLLDILQLT